MTLTVEYGSLFEKEGCIEKSFNVRGIDYRGVLLSEKAEFSVD